MLPVYLAANARAVFVPDFAASGEAIKTLKDFPLDRGRLPKRVRTKSSSRRGESRVSDRTFHKASERIRFRGATRAISQVKRDFLNAS
jgi:predicted transposase YbfD/YdcC